MRLSVTTAGFTISAMAAAAIGLVLLGAAGHEAPSAEATAQAAAMPVPVPVALVVRRTVPVYLDYIGTTEAVRTVTLQAQVTGYLAKRGASDGADVKQGELLYQIDPRDYQAALSQVKAQAQHDAAAHDYARASQHRNSMLSNDGWVAKDTLDQTTSNFYQSEATLAADAAAIQTAELRLGYTEIRAPFAGRLGKSLVHEGTLINAAGTQFNTLVELDPIYATFNPSETELAAIMRSRSKGPLPVDVQASDDAQKCIAPE
jgi:membrane fusion protein, multidrug efflux system